MSDFHLDTLDEFLIKLPFPQLMELHHKVIDLIHLHQELELLRAKSDFRIGDKVTFSHQGITYFGTITKKNPKSIAIHTDNHKDWKVSPHLLSKVHLAV